MIVKHCHRSNAAASRRSRLTVAGLSLGIAAGLIAALAPAAAGAQAVISESPPGAEAFKVPPPPPPPIPADPKTFPRTGDGKPDFTGLWSPGLGMPGGFKQPLLPQFAAKLKKWDQETDAGNPPSTASSRCEAYGMPQIMGMDPTEFIVTPGKQVTVISEELHEVRRIYLDNRAHPPKDFDPSFNGHSVGHWEGDVLVVDTIDTLPMDGPLWQSDKAHIVERIRMINRDAIVDDITVSDPARLTSDWKIRHTYHRVPAGTEMIEFVCTNNRNADANGFQTAK